MSSGRLVRAIATGRVIITNNELTTISIELRKTNPDGSVHKWVVSVRPKQTFDVSKVCSIEDIKRNSTLQSTLVKRKVTIEDTWSEEDG